MEFGEAYIRTFTNKIQLWVKIHNLLVEYRNNQYAKMIQASKNKEGNAGKDEIRKFVKFKIEIDLLNLIVSG